MVKMGRPKLFKVVHWNKKWYVMGWNTDKKKYRIVGEHKNEKTATNEVVRRYESRKMNKAFSKQIINFNYRMKDTRRNKC